MRSLRHLLGYGGSVVEKLAIKAFIVKVRIPAGEAVGKSLAELAKSVRDAN